MTNWDTLIRFSAAEGGDFWAALPLEAVPATGVAVQGFSTIEELESGAAGATVTVSKVCPSKRGMTRATLTAAAARPGARHRHPHHLHWLELPQPRQRGLGTSRRCLTWQRPGH